MVKSFQRPQPLASAARTHAVTHEYIRAKNIKKLSYSHQVRCLYATFNTSYSLRRLEIRGDYHTNEILKAATNLVRFGSLGSDLIGPVSRQIKPRVVQIVETAAALYANAYDVRTLEL